MERVESSHSDCHAASLGDEFCWDGSILDLDLSDLECQPLLASDLPHNSENCSLLSTANF